MAKHPKIIAILAALALFPILAAQANKPSQARSDASLTVSEKAEIRQCLAALQIELSTHKISTDHGLSFANESVGSYSLIDLHRFRYQCTHLGDTKLNDAHDRLWKMGPKITAELCRYIDKQPGGPEYCDVARLIIDELKNPNAVIDYLLAGHFKSPPVTQPNATLGEYRAESGAQVAVSLLDHGDYNGKRILQLLESTEVDRRILALAIISLHGVDLDKNDFDDPFLGPRTVLPTINAVRGVALHDPDPKVRYCTIRLLNKLSDRVDLIESQSQDTPELRAWQKLLKDQNVKYQITQIVCAMALRDPNVTVREESTNLLRWFPPEYVVPFLLNAARPKTTDNHLRAGARRALVGIISDGYKLTPQQQNQFDGFDAAKNEDVDYSYLETPRRVTNLDEEEAYPKKGI